MTATLAVIKYVRARMKALKYTEWAGGFNFENIPRTQLDKTFHVLLGEPRSEGTMHQGQMVRVPFSVRVFVSEARNVQGQYDAAITKGDIVRSDLISAMNRQGNDDVKNVSFNSMRLEPIGNSNDMAPALKIDFEALVIFSKL